MCNNKNCIFIFKYVGILLIIFPHKNVKSNLMKHSFTRTLKISEQKIIEQQKPSFTNDVYLLYYMYVY